MAARDATSVRETWQGVLIPDRRVVATITAGDELGPHTGAAVPDAANAGDLNLRSLRVDRAAGGVDDVELEVVRPGAGLTDGEPASIAATVGTGQQMSWMSPTPFGFQVLGSTTFGTRRTARRAGDWASVVETGDLSCYGAPDAHDLCPGARDGELLYVEIDASGGQYLIRSRTYVAGATTSPRAASQRITELVPASDTIVRLRVAVLGDGSALLLVQARASAGGVRDRVAQWASDDGGVSWRHIGSSADAVADHPWGVGDLVAVDGGFVAALATGDESGVVTTWDRKLRLARLPSARLPAWTASAVDIDFGGAIWDDSTASEIGALQVGLDIDEGGVLWLLTTTYGGARVGVLYQSTDAGISWSTTASTDSYWYAAGASSDRPSNVDLVCACGALWASWEAGSSAYQVRLGGWSSRVVPRVQAAGEAFGLTPGATATWFGTAVEPSTYGWTATGTATATATAGQVTWSGSGGSRDKRLYSTTRSGADGARVYLARWTSKASATRTSEDAPIVVEIACANAGATHGWSVRLAIGGDGASAHKRVSNIAWTALGSSASHAFGTGWVDWLARVAIDADTGDAAVTLAGRAHGGSVALATTDRYDDWVTVLSVSGALTDIPSVETSDRVAFGGYATSTETPAVAWFAYAAQVAEIGALDDAQGRPLGRLVWCPPDLLIEAGTGIAVAGDLWTVAEGADGSVQHLLDADPTVAWSAPGTDAATITLTWGDASPGQMWGLLLRGVRAETITVYGDGAQDLDLRNALGPLAGTKVGAVITPTTTSGVMWREAEATDGGALLVSDGVDNAAGLVVDARAGHWGTLGATRLVLDSIDPSVGDGPVTAYVLPRDLLLLVNKVDSYSSIEIRLGAASAAWPAGTRWSIQRAMVGPVVMFGDRWSFTESTITSVAQDEGRTSDGRPHPRALRPAARTLTIDWSDGVDDALAPESGEGAAVGDGANGVVAWAGATAATVEGLLRELRGAESDLVVVLDMPVSDAPADELMPEDGTQTRVRRHQFLHGRLTSSVPVDGVITDRGRLTRISGITIEEIT